MRGLLTFVAGALFGAAVVWIATRPLPHAHAVRAPVASQETAPPASAEPSASPPSAASPSQAPVSAPSATDGAASTEASNSAAREPPTAAAPPSAETELSIPVEGVQPGQLSDTFDQARAAGRRHDAIDIMAPRGTRVLAAADGGVVKLFTSVRGGLTVYQFDPTSTVEYYYAHLDGYAPGLAEGKILRRGDLVGFVGSTGDANPSAPHLHFEIAVLGPQKNWWQATDVNPYPILTGRQTLAQAIGSASAASPAR